MKAEASGLRVEGLGFRATVGCCKWFSRASGLVGLQLQLVSVGSILISNEFSDTVY